MAQKARIIELLDIYIIEQLELQDHRKLYIIKFMYLSLFLAVLLFIAVYKWYIKPVKLMNNYIRQFKKAGFRVKSYSYNPLTFKGYKIFQQYYKQSGDCLKGYKTELQNYDAMVTNIGTLPFIRFHRPEMIKEICAHQRQFAFEKDHSRMKFFEHVSGHGILSSEGSEWKKKRQLMNKVFNFNFVAQLTSKIKEKCSEAFEKYEQKDTKQVQYHVFDLTASISSNVTFEGFIGGQLRNEKINGLCVTDYLLELLEDGHSQIMDPLLWIFGPSFQDLGLRKMDRDLKQRSKIFNGWALNFLKQRIKVEKEKINQEGQNYKPKDIISSIVYQNQQIEENSKIELYQYSEQDMVNELKTFFIAGTDTTSHFTAAMLYHILKNPEIESALRAQVNELVKDEEYVYDDIKTMKYLDSIQKETLRMSGPTNIIFARQTTQDIQIGGVKLYKGTSFNYTSYWAHFSEQYYKNPLQFNPDRWLNGQCSNLNPFALLAFHSGSRSCIGKQLALLQSKIMIIEIMKRYPEVELVDKKQRGMKLGLLFQFERYAIAARKAK